MKLKTLKNSSRAYHHVAHHAGKAKQSLTHHSRKISHGYALVKKHVRSNIPTQAQALQWLEDSFGVTDFEVSPEEVMI